MNTVLTIVFVLACAGVFLKFARSFNKIYNKSQHTGAKLQAAGFMFAFSAIAILLAIVAVIIAWAG